MQSGNPVYVDLTLSGASPPHDSPVVVFGTSSAGYVQDFAWVVFFRAEHFMDKNKLSSGLSEAKANPRMKPVPEDQRRKTFVFPVEIRSFQSYKLVQLFDET